MSAEYDSQIADREIVNFNYQFEIYDKDNNTFFDIITVANLAYDVNKRNGYDANNKIEIKIENENNSNIIYSILSNQNLRKDHFFEEENIAKQKYFYDNDITSKYTLQKSDPNDSTKEIYQYVFNCRGRAYNNVTGRICEMTFKILEK